MSDKIVPIKAPETKPPLTVVAQDHKDCPHRRYEVHGALPRVFCADCDTDLDPFWVLRRIASDFAQRDYSIQHLKRESERLEKLVKRQMEGRRNPRRAEGDARQIAGLQRTQRSDPRWFRRRSVVHPSEKSSRRGGHSR